ncbi:hypothetical protein LXA43DRAFT_1013999 [Ganoderma leucocontextum]|nr:hypothetical protein LXA43DRAFT_1013999 [Ganoderma leucocontextum]
MAGTEALAQHPPAMKVGGRRLSINSRPRPPITTLYVIFSDDTDGIYCGVLKHRGPKPKPKPKPERSDERKANPPPADTPPDYPRPAAPGEQQVHHQQQQEEEVPKKKQGTGGEEHERRIQESLYRKAEHNRPKKELGTGTKVVNRISQPAGKPLGA